MELNEQWLKEFKMFDNTEIKVGDEVIAVNYGIRDDMTELTIKDLEVLEQEPKTGHCKDCKYFEYDSVAKVDGIPLIVAHEICSRWGNGCKTKEDGYCFLFEPQDNDIIWYDKRNYSEIVVKPQESEDNE